MTLPRPRSIPWARLFAAISARLEQGQPGMEIPSVSAVARQDSDPFRVLVATMISLRTKDEVTTRAAGKLLAAAPTAGALAALPETRIARLIYPAGFYRTKAHSLRSTARLIVDRHAGKVPRSMEGLLALPGVGRKTANLVRNLGFGLPGICVDTHVHRISNRTGWAATRNPAQTERTLMEILPRRWWIPVNELLVRFGQSVCTPLSPRCSACPLQNPRQERGAMNPRQERGAMNPRQERGAMNPRQERGAMNPRRAPGARDGAGWRCARVGVGRSR